MGAQESGLTQRNGIPEYVTAQEIKKELFMILADPINPLAIDFLRKSGFFVDAQPLSAHVYREITANATPWRMDPQIRAQLLDSEFKYHGGVMTDTVSFFPGGQWGSAQGGLHIHYTYWASGITEPLLVSTRGPEVIEEVVSEYKIIYGSTFNGGLLETIASKVLTGFDIKYRRVPVAILVYEGTPGGYPYDMLYYYPNTHIVTTPKLKHLPMPNADLKTRHVVSWKDTMY